MKKSTLVLTGILLATCLCGGFAQSQQTTDILAAPDSSATGGAIRFRATSGSSSLIITTTPGVQAETNPPATRSAPIVTGSPATIRATSGSSSLIITTAPDAQAEANPPTAIRAASGSSPVITAVDYAQTPDAQAQTNPPATRSAPVTTSSPIVPSAPAASSAAAPSAPQGATGIPLKRIGLFSSGVGYFEHSGTVNGSVEMDLVFNVNAVNDALKSLVVNDPLSPNPSIHYPSEQTLEKTLRSLSVDLSGEPSILEILQSLRGADIDVYTPTLQSGKILGVEYRPVITIFGEGIEEGSQYLSLFTKEGIKTINLKEIASFSFKNPKINADLNRALDLLAASWTQNNRNLRLSLPGEGERSVSLSYVIPTPVWKVSYRLDLSQAKPFLQGWAIVDNDSDTDWDNVTLSLVTGRPVSFIQNLYQPYHLSRPTIPLAIAGIAEAETYDSGTEYARAESGVNQAYKMSSRSNMMAYEAPMAMDRAYEDAEMTVNAPYAPAPAAPAAGVTGGNESAVGQNAGDQFEFTLRRPVSLSRQESAMLPLVEGPVLAEKALVFSVSRAQRGPNVHPAISVELTNTTGMKLPAGPITVYDQTYAGDALIEFFPENEKRIISYGDDLSVTGGVSSSNSREIMSASIAGGVLTITRRQSYEKTYSFRNASMEQKRLIIEHAITQGTTLAEPESFTEKTNTLYRFVQTLPAAKSGAQSAAGILTFTVKETMPVSERITLANLRLESLLSYSTNSEIPADVRAALQQAIELKQAVNAAENERANINRLRDQQVTEQDRTRRNLEAAGNQTSQGQEYLRRMAAQDAQIDSLNAQLDTALKAVQAAQKVYEDYIAGLKL
ncbi:DUF4139 domain-containing protein [Breznakiellaceae bacterium SP9]